MIVDVADLYEAGMASLALLLSKAGIEADRDEPTREDLERVFEEEIARAFRSISWLDIDDDESQGEDEAQRIGLDLLR